jgi:hypothetical protein
MEGPFRDQEGKEPIPRRDRNILGRGFRFFLRGGDRFLLIDDRRRSFASGNPGGGRSKIQFPAEIKDQPQNKSAEHIQIWGMTLQAGKDFGEDAGFHNPQGIQEKTAHQTIPVGDLLGFYRLFPVGNIHFGKDLPDDRGVNHFLLKIQTFSKSLVTEENDISEDSASLADD